MTNLEIVNHDESNDLSSKTKDSFESNKITITDDNEGVSILTEMDISYLSTEHFYKTNYPEYKIIKIGKFLFIKMGKLITFNFDKSNNYIPKYSIGPHWYLTLVLFIIIFSLSALLYNTIFTELNTIKKYIFIFFILSIYFLVLCTALVHPNIIMNKKRNSQDYAFCAHCKAYYNPYDKVEHCDMCGVCLPKYDHHCVWMGKCIANKNAYYFYATLIDVGIFYAFIIYCVVVMVINGKTKNKKL